MSSSGSRRRRHQNNGANNEFTTGAYASLACQVREDHAEVVEKTNTTIAYDRYALLKFQQHVAGFPATMCFRGLSFMRDMCLQMLEFQQHREISVVCP